ncbi:hypothetical protein HPB50_000972 [Hyalomma asiaticum]|uniref:Uncharacterized protein n=1 Tax=Hyalomma asiaticum TaxID=266040 RepID=A0ACB7TGM0_HYAAI|nr:hypothetical protein HPB50_000972 [Hyalomma asiaticum]
MGAKSSSGHSTRLSHGAARFGPRGARSCHASRREDAVVWRRTASREHHVHAGGVSRQQRESGPVTDTPAACWSPAEGQDNTRALLEARNSRRRGATEIRKGWGTVAFSPAYASEWGGLGGEKEAVFFQMRRFIASTGSGEEGAFGSGPISAAAKSPRARPPQPPLPCSPPSWRPFRAVDAAPGLRQCIRAPAQGSGTASPPSLLTPGRGARGRRPPRAPAQKERQGKFKNV